MIEIENPPGFVVREEAHKAAYENGFRIELGLSDGWIGYRYATARGEIWIARVALKGHWLLSISHAGVAAELGLPSIESIAGPGFDECTAQDLLSWYRVTPYLEPVDWVFASDSARAGKKRGKQPLWLSKVMQYHIQPLVKRLRINKRASWHTFRRTFTSLLTANNENIKVVQELLRHASSKITMDTYAQARMQDKRRAQLRIVKGLRKPQTAQKSVRKALKRRTTGGHKLQQKPA